MFSEGANVIPSIRCKSTEEAGSDVRLIEGTVRVYGPSVTSSLAQLVE